VHREHVGASDPRISVGRGPEGRGSVDRGISLRRKHVEIPEAFLGYVINPDFQCKDYATEAAAALVEFGFNSLRLVRIYAECNAQNVASRRVMEKLGMRMVSVRENYKEVKGVIIDSCEYELRPTASPRG